MKTIKLKKDGLHHHLVTNYCFDSSEPEDICEAISATVKSLLMVALAIALGVVLSFMVVDLVMWIYVWNTIAFVEPGVAAFALMLFSTLIGFGVCWKLASDRLSSVGESNNFAVEAYRSIKGKYCAKVEYE